MKEREFVKRKSDGNIIEVWTCYMQSGLLILTLWDDDDDEPEVYEYSNALEFLKEWEYVEVKN